MKLNYQIGNEPNKNLNMSEIEKSRYFWPFWALFDHFLHHFGAIAPSILTLLYWKGKCPNMGRESARGASTAIERTEVWNKIGLSRWIDRLPIASASRVF